MRGEITKCQAEVSSLTLVSTTIRARSQDLGHLINANAFRL